MTTLDHLIRTGLAGATDKAAMTSKLTEVQDIQQQIAALQARAALLIMEGRDDAIATIKTMMADYTIGAADLGLTLKPPRRARRPIKYRDPATGKTWTGQGVAPAWIKDKEYNEFLICAENKP